MPRHSRLQQRPWRKLCRLRRYNSICHGNATNTISSVDWKESALHPGRHLYRNEMDEDFTLTRDCLTRRMQHLNVVLNQFWMKWKKEYLLELRESHRYKLGHPDATPPAVGGIGLIHDDKPRGFWKLGYIYTRYLPMMTLFLLVYQYNIATKPLVYLERCHQ